MNCAWSQNEMRLVQESSWRFMIRSWLYRLFATNFCLSIMMLINLRSSFDCWLNQCDQKRWDKRLTYRFQSEMANKNTVSFDSYFIISRLSFKMWYVAFQVIFSCALSSSPKAHTTQRKEHSCEHGQHYLIDVFHHCFWDGQHNRMRSAGYPNVLNSQPFPSHKRIVVWMRSWMFICSLSTRTQIAQIADKKRTIHLIGSCTALPPLILLCTVSWLTDAITALHTLRAWFGHSSYSFCTRKPWKLPLGEALHR